MNPMTQITTRMFLENSTELAVRLGDLDCIKGLAARQPKTIAAGARRAQKGVHSHYVDGMPRVLPMIVEWARGSRIADLDGNEFVDLDSGRGVNFLGHSPEVVTDALRSMLGNGLTVAAGHEVETALMSLLLESVRWAEGGYLSNSGTEATMHALKLARAFTGRPVVATFENCYHGHHNDVFVARLPDGSTRPAMPGVPPSVASSTIVLPYDERAFEVISARAVELSCVILEPIRASWPSFDREFLVGLRKLTAEHGIVLVFDEIFSGFRFRFGGALDAQGITPDLATFGKIIGGGLPIGATLGRSDIIKMGVTTGDHLRDMRTRTRILGTFCGNIASCTAGLAQLGYIRDHHEEVYRTTRAAADRFAAHLELLREEAGYPIKVRRYESLVRPLFGTMSTESFVDIVHPHRHLVAEYMWTYYLRAAGVYLSEFLYPLFTYAHTAEVMDVVCEAVTQSLAGLRKDGFFCD
jgi:glutamate-1-semialdehyde 2,1-aminomutase